MDKKYAINVVNHKVFNNFMSANNITDDNVEKEHSDTAFISIVGTDDNSLHWFKQNHDNVLNLEFDDVDEDVVSDDKECKCITQQQAKDIYEFIKKNTEKEYIIHCMSGLSRSGGVAMFLRGYFDWVDVEKFDRYTKNRLRPNAKVIVEMKNAWF